MLQRYDREPGARQATPEARPEGYAAAGWRQHSSPGCAKERWERAQRSVATFPGQNVDMDKLHSGHTDHTGHAGHGARSDGHSAHNYSVAHTHTSTQRTHSSRSPPKPKAHSVPHRLRAQQPRERPPYIPCLIHEAAVVGRWLAFFQRAREGEAEAEAEAEGGEL